ncbi:MAG: hypothetical protein KC423_00420 [Anaerolineales bacterium]|nr:hypothetical protein [Anaerolineales bacterium]
MNKMHSRRAVSPLCFSKRPFSATARARRPGEQAIGIANVNPGHPAPTIVYY